MLTNLEENVFNDLLTLKQYFHSSLLSTCDVRYSTLSYSNIKHFELHLVFRHYFSFNCDETFKENIYGFFLTVLKLFIVLGLPLKAENV